MATTSKEQKFVTTLVARRRLMTQSLDNENIFVTLKKFYADVTPESQLTKDEQATRDWLMGIYNERRSQLEDIGNGRLPMPEETEYEPLGFNEPVSTPSGTGHFYSWSLNLREMKRMLKGTLELEAYPHGGLTQSIGVLHFSVPNITVREINAIASKYPELVLSFEAPVIKEGTVRKGGTVSNSRVKPVKPAPKPITIKESEKARSVNSDAVTTRKASDKELAMLAEIKSKQAQ